MRRGRSMFTFDWATRRHAEMCGTERRAMAPKCNPTSIDAAPEPARFCETCDSFDGRLCWLRDELVTAGDGCPDWHQKGRND